MKKYSTTNAAKDFGITHEIAAAKARKYGLGNDTKS